MKGGVSQQPTKGDLAVYAAKEMQRYIVSVWFAPNSYWCFCYTDTLGRFKKSNRSFPYDLDQLVLLYIVRTSKGSLQAHIGLVKD